MAPGIPIGASTILKSSYLYPSLRDDTRVVSRAVCYSVIIEMEQQARAKYRNRAGRWRCVLVLDVRHSSKLFDRFSESRLGCGALIGSRILGVIQFPAKNRYYYLR